jgi:hypothetical protein
MGEPGILEVISSDATTISASARRAIASPAICLQAPHQLFDLGIVRAYRTELARLDIMSDVKGERGNI